MYASSWAAAANAYRIAASLSPQDENLKREAAEIQQQAAAKLADGFMKQGEYESAQERWVEAAISYSKACQGKPDDAKAHDKAAHATFRARNNPRRALELAKRGGVLVTGNREATRALAAELLGDHSQSRQTRTALAELAQSRWGVSEETRMAAASAAKRIGERLLASGGGVTP
mgnify:CR=1 FL=1